MAERRDGWALSQAEREAAGLDAPLEEDDWDSLLQQLDQSADRERDESD